MVDLVVVAIDVDVLVLVDGDVGVALGSHAEVVDDAGCVSVPLGENHLVEDSLVDVGVDHELDSGHLPALAVHAPCVLRVSVLPLLLFVVLLVGVEHELGLGVDGSVLRLLLGVVPLVEQVLSVACAVALVGGSDVGGGRAPPEVGVAPVLGELSEVELHEVLDQVVHLLLALQLLAADDVLLLQVAQELPQVLQDLLVRLLLRSFLLLLSSLRRLLALDVFANVLDDLLLWVLENSLLLLLVVVD